MDINKKLLKDYQHLLQTTNIQKAYQEFITFFKSLKMKLALQMNEFTFSKTIVENRMDFAYFQITNDYLKNRGLKIQVIFNHETTQLEVWVSGYNRQIQSNYYEHLKKINFNYCLNDNPLRVDYIFKKCIDMTISETDIDMLLKIIYDEIFAMMKVIDQINL